MEAKRKVTDVICLTVIGKASSLRNIAYYTRFKRAEEWRLGQCSTKPLKSDVIGLL